MPVLNMVSYEMTKDHLQGSILSAKLAKSFETEPLPVCSLCRCCLTGLGEVQIRRSRMKHPCSSLLSQVSFVTESYHSGLNTNISRRALDLSAIFGLVSALRDSMSLLVWSSLTGTRVRSDTSCSSRLVERLPSQKAIPHQETILIHTVLVLFSWTVMLNEVSFLILLVSTP